MGIPATYKIDAAGQYGQDFRALVQTRLLNQLKAAPVLTAVLNAFADEAQEALDAVLAMMQARTLYEASGLNLDAIGRIVGQRKQLVSTDTPGNFFTPDDATLAPDLAVAWVTGALSTGSRPPNDSEYAMQILAKVRDNFNRFSSVPELQRTIQDILGASVSFELVGPMSVNILIHGLATPTAIYELAQKADTPRTDRKFFLSYPATLDINAVTQL